MISPPAPQSPVSSLALAPSPPGFHRLLRAFIYLSSFLGLLWLLAARITGPNDLWNQTQPKTVSYTTDILVHSSSHWLLPHQPGSDRGPQHLRGMQPATKPPLYNWFAVPAVKLLGFNSTLAHKFPSALSVSLLWLIILLLGRTVGSCSLGPHGSLLGPLAALMFVSNHTILKLGYLARPDMLLTLWLALGWLCATIYILRLSRPSFLASGSTPRTSRELSPSSTTDMPGGGPYSPVLSHRSRPHRSSTLLLLFFFFLTLAALTKGPAAIILLLFLFIYSRFSARSFFLPIRRNPLAFLLGSLAALAAISAWAVSVYNINPDHLINVLWKREILGRVTGETREGGYKSPLQIVLEVPKHPLFYLVRFAPWSFLSILTLICLWRSRARNSYDSMLPSAALLRLGLVSAALFAIIIIALYSLSAGKRADYLAAAYVPGSLLAAAALFIPPLARFPRLPLLVPPLAAICLTALTIELNKDRFAPSPDFSASLDSFINSAHDRLSREPLPLVFFNAGESHLQALLGRSQLDSRDDLLDRIRRRESFYVIAGSWKDNNDPNRLVDLPAFLLQRPAPVTVEVLLRSAGDARTDLWPAPLILARITPSS